MFGYKSGFLLPLFLPHVLKADRRGWALLFIDFILWKREKSPSLWTYFTFSLVLVFVPVVLVHKEGRKKNVERGLMT